MQDTFDQAYSRFSWIEQDMANHFSLVFCFIWSNKMPPKKSNFFKNVLPLIHMIFGKAIAYQ